MSKKETKNPDAVELGKLSKKVRKDKLAGKEKAKRKLGDKKNPHAVALGKLGDSRPGGLKGGRKGGKLGDSRPGGLKGGRARAAKLSPERKKEISVMGIEAKAAKAKEREALAKEKKVFEEEKKKIRLEKYKKDRS